MNTKKLTTALLLAAFAVPGLALASGASAPRPTSTSSSTPAKTPEQLATEHFNRGVSKRKQAAKLTAKLAQATTDKQREKIEAKIQKAYEGVIENQGIALGYNEGMHQAYGEIGFALRKLGRFDESLGAYGRALEMDPDYAPAIEYRAEAYLALNRTEEAKKEYVRLFALDRELASELLDAMQQFVKRRRGEPAGLSSDALDALASWVDKRQEIADQTASARDSDKPRDYFR